MKLFLSLLFVPVIALAGAGVGGGGVGGGGAPSGAAGGDLAGTYPNPALAKTPAKIYNVKDYGATGNGTTDDTTSIQAAIDAADVTGSGGTVYFPNGDYKITGVVLGSTNTSGNGRSSFISLVGESELGARIKYYGTSSGTAILFNRNKYGNLQNFRLTNMTGARSTTIGLQTTGPSSGTQSNGATMNTLIIEGFHYGWLTSTSDATQGGSTASEMTATRLTLTDCDSGFRNNDFNGLNFVFTNIDISNCTIGLDMFTAGVHVFGGAMSANGTDIKCYANGNNDFTGIRSENAGLFIDTGAGETTVTSCIATSVTGTYAAQVSGRATFKNCQFFAPIFLSAKTTLSIDDCRVKDATGQLLYFSTSTSGASGTHYSIKRSATFVTDNTVLVPYPDREGIVAWPYLRDTINIPEPANSATQWRDQTVRFGDEQRSYVQRSLTATVGDTTEIGTFAQDPDVAAGFAINSGAQSTFANGTELLVTLRVIDSYASQPPVGATSRTYFLSTTATDRASTNWYELVPLYSSGGSTGNYAVDYQGSTKKLRLRRITTAAATTKHDVYLTAPTLDLAFTGTTVTGTGATVTGYFSGTVLNQDSGIATVRGKLRIANSSATPSFTDNGTYTTWAGYWGFIGLDGGALASTKLGITFSNDDSNSAYQVQTGIYPAAQKVIGFGDTTALRGVKGITWASTPTSPAQITADQNNYNPGGSSYYQRLNTDASRNITGLTFTAAQVAGQTHVIVNVGSFNIVLANESASSTAANRFQNSTGADITIAANQAVDCWYDSTTARWRVSKRGF